MTETTKDLSINYKREDGSTYNLTIPDYLNDITDEDILAGAQAILTANIFAPSGYSFTELLTARRIDKSITDVVIPE